ncbi:AI-2E family transporter [Halosimplex amylolyticum]|uniref:AI-2E family transporter n=1 Tax=Halosimplex amylolyticum TaxID=3396616 RepID=UPI003F55D71C
MALTRRQQVLGALFVGIGLLTLGILSRVLGTVFFAITVAYVLYPVRRALVRRGLHRRLAAAGATAVGFLFVVLVLTPIVYAVYIRQSLLFSFFRSIPSEQPITAFGMTYVIDVSALITRARNAILELAVDTASAAPVLALKGFLFVFLVYGLLLRPTSVRRAMLRLVPGEYHDVVLSLHRCVRDTLYALYVLQAATAFGTFLVAYAVFWLLGYEAAFTLAFFSGLLQFIPVIGPSLLIVAVATGQALAGEVTAALVVAIAGLVLIGFLPDALIRPRLASVTTGMSASLYFVGFTGGTLSLGVVGVIAGPLIVALLVEVVEIITEERTTVQQTFDEAAADPDAPPGSVGESSPSAGSDSTADLNADSASGPTRGPDPAPDAPPDEG